MRVDEFDFDLPEDRIALRPVDPRHSARMLVVQPGQGLLDRLVLDLPDILRPGDCLVFNNIRVIPAYLEGERRRGDQSVQIKVNLIERLDGGSWWALARPGRRIKVGDDLVFGQSADPDGDAIESGGDVLLSAQIAEKTGDGRIRLLFSQTGPDLDAALSRIGRSPLPPYIASRRPADERDASDYQTMFAEIDGAVAAPTAGLHFTPELMARLSEKGILHDFVTLHVGAGTFLPVKVDDTDNHHMHSEFGEVSETTATRLNDVRAAGGRIICVGTTSLRVLETAADEEGRLSAMARSTDIFIAPGYRFRATDALMTNFHLPRSTLFMLVSALSGLRVMQMAYAHAIAGNYRFYSYGDACLLFPEGGEG